MRVFVLLSLLAVISMAVPARAQESAPPTLPVAPIAAAADAGAGEEIPSRMQGIVAECGAPVHSEISTTKVENQCDIYTRQIGYYDEQKHLKDQLRERQENFHAPHREAKANYKRALEAHHQRMGAAQSGGNR